MPLLSVEPVAFSLNSNKTILLSSEKSITAPLASKSVHLYSISINYLMFLNNCYYILFILLTQSVNGAQFLNVTFFYVI